MLLTGGKSLSVAHERLKSDEAAQRAFGRSGCADPSGIQQTLDACTPENVGQMKQAVKQLYQTHSQGYRHPYQQTWQLLDLDLNGRPCGPKAEFASLGYFARQRGRQGHQLGRVYATLYQEIVVDELYPGQTTLPTVLLELVEQAEEVLALEQWQRQRTLLRIDGHGGSRANVNALLKRGYALLTKEYSSHRARQLSQSVDLWIDDPKVAGRQVGWVPTLPDEYERPIHRIAVRTRKKNGQWGIGLLLTTLEPEQVGYLVGYTPEQLEIPKYQLLAYPHFYDLRGGGVESSFNQETQPVGFTKRAKKRFPAQQMLTQFNLLAHNCLVWFQNDLAHGWDDARQLTFGASFRKISLIVGIASFDQLSGRLNAVWVQAHQKFALNFASALDTLWLNYSISVFS